MNTIDYPEYIVRKRTNFQSLTANQIAEHKKQMRKEINNRYYIKKKTYQKYLVDTRRDMYEILQVTNETDRDYNLFLESFNICNEELGKLANP